MTARTQPETPDLETEVAELKAQVETLTAALAGKLDVPHDFTTESTFAQRKAARLAAEAETGVPGRRTFGIPINPPPTVRV